MVWGWVTLPLMPPLLPLPLMPPLILRSRLAPGSGWGDSRHGRPLSIVAPPLWRSLRPPLLQSCHLLLCLLLCLLSLVLLPPWLQHRHDQLRHWGDLPLPLPLPLLPPPLLLLGLLLWRRLHLHLLLLLVA